MPRQGEPGPPVLRVAGHEATAGLHEPLRRAEPLTGLLQPIEGKIRALGRNLDDPLPRLQSRGPVAGVRLDFAQIEVRRCRVPVTIDRGLESLRGKRRIALAQRLFAKLVFEEGENGLITRSRWLAVDIGELPAD